MKKILLLTDFSWASRHAIAYTQALFADTPVDFCLLNAFPIEMAASPGATFLLTEGRQNAQKALIRFQQTVQEASQPTHHRYRSLVMPGNPVGVVERLLTSEPFDLVVLGTTGAGESELFGSVATGIVRHAKTNVLIVPGTALIRPLQQIVVATDYRSVNDAHAFGLLRDLATRKGVGLTLLTIDNPDSIPKPTRFAREYVLRALSDVPIQVYNMADGDIGRGINTYLDTYTTDMLVMLPHHKSLLDVVLHNSVTRPFAYHPPVPLLALFDDPIPLTEAKTDEVNPGQIPMVTF